MCGIAGIVSPSGITEAHRAAYIAYLLDRLESSQIFVEEALHARNQLI